MQNENEILNTIASKRAGAFTHIVYEHKVEIAKKHGFTGEIKAVLDMIGRTGCDYYHIGEVIEKAKERIQGQSGAKRSGPEAIIKNRVYRSKEGATLIRFYPIRVRSTYFLDGNEIALSDLTAMLPEGAMKTSKTPIMSLRIEGIKKVK